MSSGVFYAPHYIDDRFAVMSYEELTDGYIERHKETAELLNVSGFLDDVREGSREVRAGGGKDLSKLAR